LAPASWSFGAAAALVLNAFQSNLVFFFTPSQVTAKEAPQGRPFRIGGMVEAGSLQRKPNSVDVQFVVTDTAQRVPVVYSGLLARPLQGRQRRGRAGFARSGRHVSTPPKVLAKHDENYMPPEAASAWPRRARIKGMSLSTLKDTK
jgi:cytochrome c-type biogenesis protein CcmE